MLYAIRVQSAHDSSKQHLNKSLNRCANSTFNINVILTEYVEIINGLGIENRVISHHV